MRAHSWRSASNRDSGRVLRERKGHQRPEHRYSTGAFDLVSRPRENCSQLAGARVLALLVKPPIFCLERSPRKLRARTCEHNHCSPTDRGVKNRRGVFPHCDADPATQCPRWRPGRCSLPGAEPRGTTVTSSVAWRRMSGGWRIHYYPALDAMLQASMQAQVQASIDPIAAEPSKKAVQAGLVASRIQSQYLHSPATRP